MNIGELEFNDNDEVWRVSVYNENSHLLDVYECENKEAVIAYAHEEYKDLIINI